MSRYNVHFYLSACQCRNDTSLLWCEIIANGCECAGMHEDPQ